MIGIESARRRKMNAVDEDLVRRLALRIRLAFETIAKDEVMPANLQGMCGRAAVQFQLEAERPGIETRLAYGEGHAFNKLADGRIVDTTATQFNGYPGAPADGYAQVEIGRIHDMTPFWYEEEDSWGSVKEWLENTDSYEYWKPGRQLFRARELMNKDLRTLCDLARNDRPGSAFPFSSETDGCHEVRS
jgi:hypothetical protein